MNYWSISALFLFWLVQAPIDTKPPATAPVKVVDHAAWDVLLQAHVTKSGKVDYEGFKDDKAKLQNYLDLLSNNPPQGGWSKAEQLSYWINAYNAFTVKLIVDNYPLKSITDLDGGKPWDQKRIKIGDKKYSLNNIENDIIRPQFKEPRIHFAVNCAAKSCPPLLNRAWTAQNLEAQLERQTRRFINNSAYNQVSSKTIKISKIFEWYAVDFENIQAFVNKYTDVAVSKSASVSYNEYNWSLNKQ